jgi:hypothetical protein
MENFSPAILERNRRGLPVRGPSKLKLTSNAPMS